MKHQNEQNQTYYHHRLPGRSAPPVIRVQEQRPYALGSHAKGRAAHTVGAASSQGRKKHLLVKMVVAAALLVGGVAYVHHPADAIKTSRAADTAQVNHCTNNPLARLIKVSVSARHLWACSGGHEVYNTAVITGDERDAADATPLGSYEIYAKATDTTLRGSDSKGGWSDPVYYWMPFYDNQFGTYGFHDATWRKNDVFGKVSPNSSAASHGCIELPLAASKWLYNWAPVGTTVSIGA